MGMIGYLLRVKPSELDAILNNSALLEEKIANAITDQSAELSDLDKSWEAIYYLITGSGISGIGEAEPPLAWTLFSGQEIDPEQDLGYGPGFYTTVEQVKQVDAALQDISQNEIISRFDGPRMNRQGIYPEIWDEDDTIDYVLENFEAVKKCYGQAAANGEAVISFIS
jgi:hypothetical protein